MTRRTWNRLKSDATTRLIEACGKLSDQAEALEALSSVVALAELDFTVGIVDGRLEPDLRTRPHAMNHQLARELLDLIAEFATDHTSSARPDHDPALGGWIEERGFSDLMIALLEKGAEWQTLTALARIVANAIASLAKRSRALAHAHVQKIVVRDLPAIASTQQNLSVMAAWLLAPETSGQPHRAEILQRRLQAATIYGALSMTLRQPDVTEAIDTGRLLAPLLMARHTLTAAELRALRGVRHLADAIENQTDFHVAIEELKAHQVALCEWPGLGRPEQSAAWERSVWIKSPRQHFVRPDYLGPDGQGVTDAIEALRQDLLRPIVAERIRLGGFKPNHQIGSFAQSLTLSGAKGGGEPRRLLLSGLHNAIVGPRKPRAFHEAVGIWHRCVASLSALRHERRADRPGWPRLCAPWVSPCGRFEVMALSSAADLVEEGRLLDHCVGGYYDICRRGDTQILSLREAGRRAATIEVKLGEDSDDLTFEIGQFKARRNTAPLAHHHEGLREFLRAIRTGRHPVEAQAIARHRKRMRKIWDGNWHSDAMTLAHAREVFSFYLPLLPRGTPPDLDSWAESSGLNAVLDGTLVHLETGPRVEIDTYIPH